MAWRYHGCFVPDPYRGRAHGQCDRCNRQWALNDLQYQYDFRGDTGTKTRGRVFPEGMDKPYEGNRPVKIPPDPVPVLDPRVEPFLAEENAGTPFVVPAFSAEGYTTEYGSSSYVTEDGTGIYVPE